MAKRPASLDKPIYDDEELLLHLSDEQDTLSQVVRAHLYTEQGLYVLLNSYLRHPEKINLDRLNFRVKLDLCVALGLIPVDLHRPLHGLNTLRNRYAHSIHFKLTRQDVAEIVDVMSEYDRETAFVEDGKVAYCRTDVPLSRVLATLVIRIDVIRQRVAEAVIENKKLSEQVKEVLARYKK